MSDKRSIAIAASAACIVMVMGICANGIYQDRKADRQHEIMKADVTDAVAAVKPILAARQERLHPAAQKTPAKLVSVMTTRVTDLPNLSGWYLIVYAQPQDTAVDNWFVTNARLARFRTMVRYYRYGPTDKAYIYRTREWVGDVSPAVVLQDPSGDVVYQAAGSQLPRTADELADQMNIMMLRYSAQHGTIYDTEGCPLCRPKPVPPVVVAPLPVPPAAPQPYIGPAVEPTPEPDSISNGALVAIGLAIGAVIYLVHHVLKTTRM